MLAALEAAGRDAGAEVSALRLDQLRSYSTNHSGERPHKVLPDGVRRAMLSAQASAFVASAPHGESSMREQLLHVVGGVQGPARPHAGHHARRVRDRARRGLRQARRAGSRASSEGSRSRARSRARAPRGRKLTIKTGAEPSLGRTPRPRRARRVGHAPRRLDLHLPRDHLGHLRGDGERRRVLRRARGPARASRCVFEIVDGRVMNVIAPELSESRARHREHAPRRAQLRSRRPRRHRRERGDRRSPPATSPSTRIAPGLHLVFGDPMAKLTGATWSARTCFAACQARGSVRVDGTLVADDGKLVAS